MPSICFLPADFLLWRNQLFDPTAFTSNGLAGADVDTAAVLDLSSRRRFWWPHVKCPNLRLPENKQAALVYLFLLYVPCFLSTHKRN